MDLAEVWTQAAHSGPTCERPCIPPLSASLPRCILCFHLHCGTLNKSLCVYGHFLFLCSYWSLSAWLQWASVSPSISVLQQHNYSEMANHWWLVMWPRHGRITTQPFVPLYLSDNLFVGDINMNKIMVSLHKSMFLTTQKKKKILSRLCLEKAFRTLVSRTRLLPLIRCDLEKESEVVESLCSFLLSSC